MSGIIGGAGSKSGVIGITELDYEEGTFTATARSETGTPTKTANYTKIGRTVTFSITIGSIASNGTTLEFYISGLPFTCLADTAISVGPMYRIDYPVSLELRSQVAANQSYCTFYWTRDDTSYIIATCANFAYSSAGIAIAGTYMTT
tara:strand:- start:89 stop:529 length:441 start_codon:yes stop_codon:yes gene_type:complete